jgi:hypothetical protein
MKLIRLTVQGSLLKWLQKQQYSFISTKWYLRFMYTFFQVKQFIQHSLQLYSKTSKRKILYKLIKFDDFWKCKRRLTCIYIHKHTHHSFNSSHETSTLNLMLTKILLLYSQLTNFSSRLRSGTQMVQIWFDNLSLLNSHTDRTSKLHLYYILLARI